jgi:ribosomal protein S18 acetylase RimI-like enzyme
VWTWWRGDSLSLLPDVGGLAIAADEADEVVARLAGYTPEQVSEGRGAGNRAYVARLDGASVAYGWSASRRASFGPQETAFEIPPGNCYLWGFVTLPAWRGRGLYPRLLQHIVRAEQPGAERFWALHDAENRASARGLFRAGFALAGHVYFLADGGFGLVAMGAGKRALAGAALLGMAVVAPPNGFEVDPLDVMH